LLKPTKRNTQIFLYCLAVAANKFNIVIHSVCVLSNHYHLVVSDSKTRIAKFYGWLHKYVAKAINASYGRFENLWASEKTSVISLEERNDVMDKIVYTMSNPVAARLVASGNKWPGVWLYKRSHSQVVKRPDVYFTENGSMPKQIRLNIKPPSKYGRFGFDKYEQLVSEKLEVAAEEIQSEMGRLGQSFLGIRGIMQQNPKGNPVSREKRFGINPKIAAKNKWLRLEAIQRHKEFLYEYREALKRWREGDRDVIFPLGTYSLRIHAGVKCEPG
jgi:REP element-mobilizing transposase RayT